MQKQIRGWSHLLNVVHGHRRVTAITAILLVALAAVPSTIFAAQQGSPSNVPGTHDGRTQLINNWTVTPAGRQTDLGDLPLNSVLSPDGRYLLVSNSGAGVQSLQVIETKSNTVIQSIPYDVPHSVFVGLAYSQDGKKVYASGGGEDVIHTFDAAASGKLTATGDISIGTKQSNPFPTGLSVSRDGTKLYVANNLANTVAVVDTQTRQVTQSIKIGSYPYTTLMSKDGKTIYASNWGDATISIINAATNAVTATVPVGQHPTAMALSPDGTRLYVTDANSDAVSVVNTDDAKEAERISVSPYKGAPLSSSPQGLAISPNGQFLYVVDAGNNEVAVIERHGDRHSVIGRIPTAWYPTSVSFNPTSNMLLVTNGKGLGAGPNDKPGTDPNPTRRNAPVVNGVTGYNDGYCNCSFDQYSGSMIVGTLSSIALPGRGQLAVYTDQVARNDREQGNNEAENEANGNNPIPLHGQKSPIKHVIYIIKENRTYDQVFGDMPSGNGDPNLTLFPKNNTPNLHALANRFGLLDNFYADAEVSADGHNWATSANATDYNEKMWPQNYSPGPGRNRPYDFEGDSKINLSPGGYLWDSAAQAGISYRDYGEFYKFSSAAPHLIPADQASSCPGPIAHSYTGVTIPAGQVLCFPAGSVNPQTTPNLVGHFDPKYRTFDSNYRESDRVAEWQREFNQFVSNDNLPQLEFLRLPNDHTQGTTPGKLTPQAAVAENDNAVGQVIDTLSHSKYWGSTAVFVTEDDAQNGPDHVDAHRTESLAISPYTSRTQSATDHTLYDTAAMVRTMELILGLHPLSQYDANAVPMWRSFTNKPNLAPYTALPESIPVTQTNSTTAYGAQDSAKMNFAQEDEIPMDQLNQILWHSVKGANAPYPTLSNSLGSNNVPAASRDSDG
ncbi:beta-propeller fold lactonase family protein [Dictyobacter halimunensis]